MKREKFVTIAACNGEGLQLHLIMYFAEGNILSTYDDHRAMYPLESCKQCAQVIEQAEAE
jgi:hypothetical protein